MEQSYYPDVRASSHGTSQMKPTEGKETVEKKDQDYLAENKSLREDNMKLRECLSLMNNTWNMEGIFQRMKKPQDDTSKAARKKQSKTKN